MSPRINITEYEPGTLASAIEGFADLTRDYWLWVLALAALALVIVAARTPWRMFDGEG